MTIISTPGLCTAIDFWVEYIGMALDWFYIFAKGYGRSLYLLAGLTIMQGFIGRDGTVIIVQGFAWLSSNC